VWPGVRSVASLEDLEIRPHLESRAGLFFRLHSLLAAVPRVVVHGIPTIERCIINYNQASSKYELYAEGMDLLVRSRDPP
jgi:hypothetical protein